MTTGITITAVLLAAVMAVCSSGRAQEEATLPTPTRTEFNPMNTPELPATITINNLTITIPPEEEMELNTIDENNKQVIDAICAGLKQQLQLMYRFDISVYNKRMSLFETTTNARGEKIPRNAARTILLRWARDGEKELLQEDHGLYEDSSSLIQSYDGITTYHYSPLELRGYIEKGKSINFERPGPNSIAELIQYYSTQYFL